METFHAVKDAVGTGSELTTSVVGSESRLEQFTQPCEEDANAKLIASVPSGMHTSFLTSVLSGLDHSSTNAIEVIKSVLNSSPNKTSKSVGFGDQSSSVATLQGRCHGCRGRTGPAICSCEGSR